MKTLTHLQQTDFVIFDTRKCKACRRCRCEANCPEIIGKTGGFWHRHVQINYPERCIGCLQCVKLCPAGAFSPSLLSKKAMEI